MHSPEKTADQVLGTSVKVIKDFLMECVNLPDPLVPIVPVRNTPYADWNDVSPQFERWLRRWRRMFTFQTEGEDRKLHSVEIPREQLERLVPEVRTALRRIWIEPNARQRDWSFYRLRDAYHHMIVKAENAHLLDPTDLAAMERFEQVSHARGDDPGQNARFYGEWMGLDLLADVPRICMFEPPYIGFRTTND